VIYRHIGTPNLVSIFKVTIANPACQSVVTEQNPDKQQDADASHVDAIAATIPSEMLQKRIRWLQKVTGEGFYTNTDIP